MPRLQLTAGAYQTRSVIASAQRSLNLFGEPMPMGNQLQATTGAGESASWAFYPTPGLRRLCTLPQGRVRGVWQATTGGVYAVAGTGVYRLHTNDWSSTHIGDITPGIIRPVGMADNGLQLVIVDGSPNGWTVTLADDTFAEITEDAFYGADRAAFLDTYLLFNKPGTPQFYASDSLATTFDPLYFADKESFSDELISIAVAKREIWLLGSKTTEVWYNTGGQVLATGGTDFPFQEQGGTFVDTGCAAVHSVATHANAVYWLGRDRNGQGVVMRGIDYAGTRISTFPIENVIANYAATARIDDAIGFIYQLGGHAVYVLTFPHADATWAFDITTGQWHEWRWIDDNGEEHRHRANCCAAIDGVPVVGDWQNGNVYALDRNVFTDDGQPIKRERAFPHILNDGNRVFYHRFIADIETGMEPGTGVGPSVVAPYDVTMVQLDAGAVGGWGSGVVAASAMGFPAGNFRTLLYSQWMCSANSAAGPSGVSPSFTAGYSNFVVGPAHGTVTLGNASGEFFAGSFAPFAAAVRTHMLLSVDAQTQTIQLYLNDAPVTVTGTWTGAPGSNWFNVGTGSAAYGWNGENAAITNPPAVADIWCCAPVSFVDLTIVANRRRFINGDLTPVSLGSDGSGPLGFQPQIYCTATPFGAAADLLVNRGVGASFVMGAGNALSFQAPGVCALPPATPTPPDTDAPCLISLEWSNDRGHSWSNPVSQPMGGTGEYGKTLTWNRLGYARDRVFRLTWSCPASTALQGGWIEVSAEGKGQG